MRKSLAAYWLLEMFVFYKHFNNILSQEMSAPCKGVYLSLVMRSNDKNQSFPSLTQLAKDSSLGRSTVARAIASLVESGHITQVKRFSQSTVYTVTIPTAGLVPERDECQSGTHSSLGAGLGVVPERDSKSTIKNTKEEYNEDENPFNGKPAKVDPMSESSIKAAFLPFVMIGLKTQEEDMILIRECISLCGGFREAAKEVVKIKDRVTKNTKYDRIFPSVFLAEVRSIQSDKEKSERESFDKEYAEAEFMAIHTEKLIAANKKAEEEANAPF